MAEEQKNRTLNKELIPKLESSLEKLREQSRNHLLQICLISGVIATFLMPLYISKDFSSSQHCFIALSLICFLLAILIGVIYLSCKFVSNQRDTLELIDILETDDKNRAAEFYKKHHTSLSWRKSNDIKAWLSDILFAGGVIFLIVVIFVNETGWYYFKR